MSAVLSVLSVALSLSFVTRSEAADAACSDPRFSAYTNSLGQDPCKVASNMINSCPGSDGSAISALEEGYYYSGFQNPSDCVCNTVYYSELAVCAYCQGGDIEVWGTWNVNCTTTYDKYPGTLPIETNVQSWAYLPLRANGTLDSEAVRTEANSGGPEAVGPTSSQSTLGPSDTSSSTSFTIPTTTRTLTSSSESASASSPANDGGGDSEKSTPVGAIVGGVVGGVAALVALGLVFFFCRRRKRQNSGFDATTVAGDSVNEKPHFDSNPQVTPFFGASPHSTTQAAPLPYNPDLPYDPDAPYNADPSSPVSDGRASYYSQPVPQPQSEVQHGSQYTVYTPQPTGDGQARYSMTNQAAGGGGGAPRYPEAMSG